MSLENLPREVIDGEVFLRVREVDKTTISQCAGCWFRHRRGDSLLCQNCSSERDDHILVKPEHYEAFAVAKSAYLLTEQWEYDHYEPRQ